LVATKSVVIGGYSFSKNSASEHSAWEYFASYLLTQWQSRRCFVFLLHDPCYMLYRGEGQSK